jgi:hypothetical protein
LRLVTLLHDAKALMLDLGGADAPDVTAWGDRITAVTAEYSGPWELPVVGPVRAPTALLVRPDGYVAWVGQDGDAGLREALTTWCGAA